MGKKIKKKKSEQRTPPTRSQLLSFVFFLLAIAFFSVLVVAEQTEALTYYFDATNGDDANDGLTTTTAWKTTLHASNEISAGTILLFKRGEEWRTWKNNLRFDTDGTDTSWITIADYGTGERPILNGALDKSSTSNWTQYNATVWYTGTTPSGNGTELNPNPYFDTDSNNWTVFCGGTATCTGTRKTTEYYGAPASFLLNITAADNSSYSKVEMYLRYPPIEKNEFYIFSFYAKANDTVAFPIINILNSTSPYTQLHQTRRSINTTTIGTNWVKYELLFHTTKMSPTGRVSLYFGNCSDGKQVEIYFDNISLQKTSDQDTLAYEVGNLRYNNIETSNGVKKSDLHSLTTQGDFYHNTSDFKTYVYSSGNPATYYSDIELWMYPLILDLSTNGNSYFRIENISLKNTGSEAIHMGFSHDNELRNIDINNVGGAYQHEVGTIRFGVGIEMWDTVSNITIENVNISQVYDGAYGIESSELSGNVNNITIRNSLVRNSEFCYSFFQRHSAENDYNFTNIYFENNTCINTGYAWASSQRPTRIGYCFVLYTSNVTHKNVFIRNNICYNSFFGGVYYNNQAYNFSASNISLTNNDYFGQSNLNFTIISAKYNYSSISVYNNEYKQDNFSAFSNPMFSNAVGYEFRPIDKGGVLFACHNSTNNKEIGALSCIEDAWSASVSVDTSVIRTKFTTNIWGTNFDQGFGQRGNPTYCQGTDLFDDATGIARRTALGQTYARVWFTKQANNTLWDAASIRNWTMADKIIADVVSNNVTPMLVLCGYASEHCIENFGNDTEYEGHPNRTAFINYTKAVIDRYSSMYNISEWKFLFINEPWNYGYGAFDSSPNNYSRWWMVVYEGLTGNYSGYKYGANPDNNYEFIHTSNHTYSFLENHIYGENGDPTSDPSGNIMYMSWNNSALNQFSCQKWSITDKSLSNVTCIMGEHNWHSGVNGSNDSDPRQDTRFVGAWTSSLIGTVLNSTYGSSNIALYNETYFYTDTNCDNEFKGLGLYKYNNGNFTPTWQYEVFYYLKNYAKFNGNLYHIDNQTGTARENVSVVVFESNVADYQYFAMITNRKNATGTLTLNFTGYDYPEYSVMYRDVKTGVVTTTTSPVRFTLQPFEVKFVTYDLLKNNPSWEDPNPFPSETFWILVATMVLLCATCWGLYRLFAERAG